MLQLMGFGDVQFWPDRPNKIKSAQNHPVPGYLLANSIESNGRVLGLVFPGRSNLVAVDGDHVFVDEAILETSVNTALVGEGLAYGELYATMTLDLILGMQQLVAAARRNDSGCRRRMSPSMPACN